MDCERHFEAALDFVKKQLNVADELALAKLPQLLHAVEKEQCALSSQLHNIAHSQVSESQKAMVVLHSCFGNISLLAASFQGIIEDIDATQPLLKDYNLFQTLHYTLENIHSTEGWVNRFLQLREEVNHLREKIVQNEVVVVYDALADLVKFRSTVQSQIDRSETGSKDDYTDVFQEYFQLITEVSDELVSRVVDLLGTAIDYFVEDDREPKPVFAALDVVQRERDCIILPADGDPNVSRLHAFLPFLERSFERRWSSVVGDSRSLANCTVAQKLDRLRVIVEDIAIWHYDLVSRLPLNVQPARWVVTLYHRKLVNFLHSEFELKAKQITSPEQLLISDWIERYSKVLDRLELRAELPEEEASSLGDLVGTFQEESVERMQDFVSDMAAKYLWSVCREPLECNRDGWLHTMGPVDLFKLLHQQLASLQGFSPPRILLRVAQACGQGMERYERELLAWCSVEKWKEKEGAGTGAGGAWVEERLKRLVAFTNDMQSCLEHCHILKDGFVAALRDPAFEEELSDVFEACLSSFFTVGRQLLALTADHVLRVCIPAET
eukprot:TRINITY_DN25481_c0_g1_i1.p1 TRINITY_DN25481_c0_g1~~TRINITY_DN25481_c0_g1_i1.p1  ORF type:complete len:562 (+),score=130.20 TRINITY_DN25481_c0_g1_i1:25-1686(+)